MTLAGCGGDGGDGSGDGGDGGGDGGDGGGDGDGGGGDGGDGDGGSNVIDDPVFTQSGGTRPEQLEANPYNPNDNFAGWSGPDWLRPTVFTGDTGEWHHRTVEDWSYDGETFEVNFNTDYNWTDGETITAEDFVTNTFLNMHTGAPIGNYLESIEAPDETTAVATLSEDFAGMNEAILLQQIFHWSSSSYSAPTQMFGEYVERLRNAGSEDEEETIVEELVQWHIAPEDAIWSGVAVFEEKGERRLLKTIRDDFPNTENINFTEWESIYGLEGEEAILGGKTDNEFTSMPDAQVPEKYAEQGAVPVYMGHAISFQHGHELYGDRRVRKAIGYIMDNEKWNEVIETHGTHLKVEHQTAMPPQYAAESLGGDTDFLTDYGVDYDRAAELLREAGFSKSGDTWNDPNGNEFAPEVYAPEWWPETAQFMASELQSFGLNAEARSAEFSTFNTDVNVNGDFGMAWGFVGATFLPHPYFDYEAEFLGETQREIWNMGPTYEVPMPVGDPEGEMQEVDTREKVNNLLFAQSEEEEVAATRELAWIYNQVLPTYQFDTYSDTWVWNTSDWDLPADDSWMWSTPHPAYLVFEEGEIQAAPGTPSQV